MNLFTYTDLYDVSDLFILLSTLSFHFLYLFFKVFFFFLGLFVMMNLLIFHSLCWFFKEESVSDSIN